MTRDEAIEAFDKYISGRIAEALRSAAADGHSGAVDIRIVYAPNMSGVGIGIESRRVDGLDAPLTWPDCQRYVVDERARSMPPRSG